MQKYTVYCSWTIRKHFINHRANAMQHNVPFFSATMENMQTIWHNITCSAISCILVHDIIITNSVMSHN